MTVPTLQDERSPIPHAPATAADFAAVLADAQAAGERVIVAGKGLRLDIGNPVKADRLLLTTRLDRLVDYQPDDLTVTAEAGMTLADLQAVLAKHQQRLALDPAMPAQTTLGGLVAASPDGPWRAAYGTVRDQLLGLTVASPDGNLFKSGSRVVKHVAGYDLPKLFAGSFGTLGAILQTSWRVRPLPPATGAVISRGLDPMTLADAWNALRQAPLEPAYFEVGADATGGFLAMGFEGEPEAVAWQLAAFEAHVRAPVERADDGLRAELAARTHAEGAPLLIKVGLPPKEAVAFLIQAQQAFGREAEWAGRAGNGLLYASFPKAAGWEPSDGRMCVEALRREAAARQGYLVVLRAPLSWKQDWDVWGPTRPDFALMKAIKRAFDPHNILAPGRFVGGI